MSRSRAATLATLVTLVLCTMACRRDPSEAETSTTGEFGGAGAGYTAQCSGWFPDWISPNPPPAATASFQLAQGYPRGIPVFGTVNGETQVVSWNPLSPATTTSAAPWLAHDFHVAAQRLPYLNALKNYVLQGMDTVDFVAQNNTQRRWYHVPMMTTSPTSRREPYRGTTKERPLFASTHDWIVDGNQLDSFAVGYYNGLGGYTLGQVFDDPNPAMANPERALFIDGALVFKLIFAEHDPAKIVAALDPMVGAPTWQVQDVEAPAAALKTIKLLQLDIAVRDSRSAQTGWVFATYVYDQSLAAVSNPWRRLTPIGLQWGNDPDVTGPGTGTLDETWINGGAIPAVFQNHLGRDGRLNGPVDNPASSCVSCHSTAQVVTGATPLSAFRGARLVPPAACTNAQDMTWFRNVPAGTPFGTMASNGTGCTLAASQPATPPLHSTDYSLQLADGLESSLFYNNPNPCQAMAQELLAMAAGRRNGAGGRGGDDERQRMLAPRLQRLPLDREVVRKLAPQREESVEKR